MSQWQIHIEGDETDIRLLRDLLTAPPYSIAVDNSRTYLTIPDCPPDAPGGQVHAAARSLIEAVNGAAKLYYHRFGGVRYTTVSRIGPDGRRIGFGYLTAPPRDTHLTVTDPSDPTLANWVSLARTNEHVARALSILGALEQNWKNLYLVVEVIEESLGGKSALKAARLADSADLTRFKRTANSFRAIGRDARHAKTNFKAPASPMSLQDAQAFTNRLVRDWIASFERQSA